MGSTSSSASVAAPSLAMPSCRAKASRRVLTVIRSQHHHVRWVAMTAQTGHRQPAEASRVSHSTLAFGDCEGTGGQKTLPYRDVIGLLAWLNIQQVPSSRISVSGQLSASDGIGKGVSEGMEPGARAVPARVLSHAEDSRLRRGSATRTRGWTRGRKQNWGDVSGEVLG